jgi:uncharacterized membrane protein YdjX (TVP38/TMEM64 family)
MPQVLAIFGVFFFSVVVVNALDLTAIRERLQNLLGSQGDWSRLVFLLMTVLLYALTIPSTVLGAASGATFGIFQGSVVYVLSCLGASLLVYLLSRTLLRGRIEGLVRGHDTLQSVERVIRSEGLWFLFLVRYVPVHATLISALLGMGGIRTGRFLISCLFLLPEWVLHVYVGHVAASTPDLAVHGGWEAADLIRVVSLALAIGAVAYLGLVARKAIEGAKR